MFFTEQKIGGLADGCAAIANYNASMRPGSVVLAAASILLFGAGTLTRGFSGQALVKAKPQQKEASIAQSAASILQINCVKCHDSVKKTAGIDLSTRSAAVATAAIDLAALDKSRLLEQVSQGLMPPTVKLPDESIEVLKQWVAGGAPYLSAKLVAFSPAMMPLWSFQPVRPQKVPKSPFDKLAQNPIDKFIFAKLSTSGLSPAPKADKLTLLRRVTFDLTGLPPSPSEVSAFLKDTSPKAYEKVVDRLLASSAYGERWGRHWLDVVRYGESDGYERNIIRNNSWPYRDYVIRAFNQDLPFTDFVTQQLAGDAVSNGDPAIEAATGFLVAGIHDTVDNSTEEGTRQKRINDLEDITSTAAASFLAVTVGCARCHDHKFDPVPQKDFYRLAAVFAGVRFGERSLVTGAALAEHKKEKAELAHEAFNAINALNTLDDEARQKLLSSAGRPAVNARRNVDSFPMVSARFVRFTVLATRDGSEPCLDELQIFGPDSADDYALAGKPSASGLFPNVEAHKIEHLNDGRFGNEYSWISNTRGTGWAQIELPAAKNINRVVWSRDGAEIPKFDDRLPTKYRIEVSTDASAWQTVSTDDGRAEKDGQNYVHPDALIKTMTPEQRTQREAVQKTLRELREKGEALDANGSAYAGQFTQPDPMFVLRRGDVMQRTDPVTPGALSQIKTLSPDLSENPNAPEPERRLAFAHWIGSPKNPLTARVIVNRIWQYHFGRGIVGTPSDFGRNGEKPSHAELLDWLANDFVVNGWKMKRLQKLMVMSYTYCQSGALSAKGEKVDASNHLLWRMPLQRMEAEVLRDSILATSGKLDRRMGGPGFRLFKYSEVNVAIYDSLENYGPETWRRSVYRSSARAIRDELLETFDCPENAQRAPKRENTTTALQALSLLNGKFMVQQAGFFADRVLQEGGPTPGAQTVRAFQIAFCRPPTAAEKTAALRLVADRGLVTLCRALMNANEFLYY